MTMFSLDGRFLSGFLNIQANKARTVIPGILIAL